MTGFIHPCGSESAWGRCELHDEPAIGGLWGVAVVVPGPPEHLHPYQYCETEARAVEALNDQMTRPSIQVRTPMVLIHRDNTTDKWEAWL